MWGTPRGCGLLRFLTSRCQLPPGDARPVLRWGLRTIAHACDGAPTFPGGGGVTVPGRGGHSPQGRGGSGVTRWPQGCGYHHRRSRPGFSSRSGAGPARHRGRWGSDGVVSGKISLSKLRWGGGEHPGEGGGYGRRRGNGPARRQRCGGWWWWEGEGLETPPPPKSCRGVMERGWTSTPRP